MNYIIVVLSFLFVNEITAQKSCHLRELDLCLATLLVSGNQNTLPMNDKEMERMCKNYHDTQNCLNSYTKRCSSPLQRETVKWMTDSFIQELEKYCTKGTAERKEFFKYAPCLNEANKERNGCFTGVRNALEKVIGSSYDKRIAGVCCTFKSYESCAGKAVEKTCGKEGSDFARKLMSAFAGRLPEIACQGYKLQGKVCQGILPPPGWTPDKKSNSVLSRLMTAYLGV